MFSEQVWVRVLQHVNNRNVWCEHMGPMAGLFVHCIFWKLFKTPVLYSSSEGNVFFFFFNSRKTLLPGGFQSPCKKEL